ncbi:MAG TPA: radical SAM protein [Vicinamibacterales bacterium]
MRVDAVKTSMLVALGTAANRTFVLPIVIFFPTSRCNSRCISCDWWKASGAGDLSIGEIAQLAAALPALGTRMVLFSGGEPLLRPEVFEAAGLFRQKGIRLHLHTSGVLLERVAADVARHFERVIVSLDAATEPLYAAIRGVNALNTVERGVARLRALAPDIPVAARTTLHRQNFRELRAIVEHARAAGFDSISFLAADLSSNAFGRTAAPRGGGLMPTAAEIAEFAGVVEETIARCGDQFESGFITDSPDKLRRLPQYYAALVRGDGFPPVDCNAPFMSVVVEADGAVRPCFFHEPVGNIRLAPLGSIVARNLPAFRESLNIGSNPVCERCVCSKRTSWRSAPWQ